MLLNKRQEDIMQIIKDKKYVRPKILADELYASISTIRRDLIHLEKLGLIQKSHGQISLFQNNELAHSLRQRNNYIEKIYISKLASNYIESGQTIFLDSSTTVNTLCPFLNEFRNLTIITNSLKNAMDLSENTGNQVSVAGGILKPYSVSLLGEYVCDFIKKMNIDIAFLSCRSLDLNGIYDEDFKQGYVKEVAIARSNQTILLSDHSKLYKKDFYTFADYKQIHAVILDQKPEEQFISECNSNDCEVVW